MHRAIIFSLLALVGCATPQERCIINVSKDLRVVDRLVAETQANVDRGYAYSERRYIVFEREICGIKDGENVYCTFPETRIHRYPVAIDLDVEKQKLNSLLAKRSQLASKAAAEIAECKSAFPEV